jgi:hemoglobin
MKRPIKTREDIKFMVDEFYTTAKKNTLIGHFFNEVVVLDWDKHMPTMYDFWSDLLLGTCLYKGNPMIKHFVLNEKSAMRTEHFKEWLTLWKDNINAHFEGVKAEEAISRAENIARLMEHKVGDE